MPPPRPERDVGDRARVAMALGVYAIVGAPQHGWTSGDTLGFGTASVALLTAFIALEARLSNPILPLRLLRLRSLVGSSVVRAMMGMGMYGTFFSALCTSSASRVMAPCRPARRSCRGRSSSLRSPPGRRRASCADTAPAGR